MTETRGGVAAVVTGRSISRKVDGKLFPVQQAMVLMHAKDFPDGYHFVWNGETQMLTMNAGPYPTPEGEAYFTAVHWPTEEPATERR